MVKPKGFYSSMNGQATVEKQLKHRRRPKEDENYFHKVCLYSVLSALTLHQSIVSSFFFSWYRDGIFHVGVLISCWQEETGWSELPF